MLETNKTFLRIILVACLPTTVTASWWDDFTNNLATDLTPLIALFGEQATKQFLSESTTVLDNFLFAMAPLGILTGVVSAIRVCGGPSLRAFIGRAQEGGGIAEAELCSSTSRDVCELYHNGAIVRVFGPPKILEIVYDSELEEKDENECKNTVGINISREYFQTAERNGTGWEEEGKEKTRHDTENNPFSTKNCFDNFAPNPNLSLNIGIVKRSSFVHIGAAIIGFVSQTSVLVLSAIVTYRLHWKKNGNSIDPWAFPFIFAGTTCVCLGMFLCATLVNDSTKERVFAWKDGQKTPMLYVVQPGSQVVGDQTFDPFLFSKPIKRYMTSWKVTHSSDSSSGFQSRPSTTPINQFSFKKLRNPSEELSVLAATFITTIGFALQFVGLRAMHSVVSLLQLAVTLLMSVVRALLRTQRLSIDENVLRDRPDEVNGHELDWMALQMAKDANDPRCFWSVTVQAPTQHSQPSSKSVNNKAWKYRSRLAELTGQSANAKSKLSNAWGNDLVSGRLQAQQLKKAIEGSLAILEDHAKVGTDIANLSWILNVAIGEYGETSYRIQSIKVNIQQLGSVWTVDPNHLEAIIGLWSWSIISDSRTEEISFGLKTSTAADKPMYRAITAGTKDEIERSWREIQFWIERPNTQLSKFNTRRPRSLSILETDATTILEQDEQILADELYLSTPASMSNPYQRLFGLHGIDIRNGPTIAATKIESKHIPIICSQDIYQSFLQTISAYLDFKNEATVVTGNTMGLENQLVTKLIDCFEASGLGPRQDASLVIIPTLQSHSRLPRNAEAIPAAYRVAENFRKSNNFKEAEKVLRWVWGVMTELGEPRDMALLELGELYRYALFSDKWQEFGQKGINWMHFQENAEVSSLESEVIARYVDLEKRHRESRTEQYIFDAILRNDRNETLWSISQLYRSEHGLPTDEESGRSVLSFLCQKGWLELVRASLEIGSIIDSTDKQGRTPLSYAAEHEHSSIVNILIEANALPFTEDSNRRSPLSYASGNGHVSVMERLMSDPRVNLDSKDIRNGSPLHWAAANCRKDAINCLIDHGAQINAKDDQKRSPLHWAAENGNHDAIRCLVDHGARIDDVDSNEYTPLVVSLLNTSRSRFDRNQTADLLVRMKAKLDYAVQGKELWEWALENGEYVCAEYILGNFPREDFGVVVDIITPNFLSRKDQHKGSLFPLPPDFQSGFRVRIFHGQTEKKEITTESILSIVEGSYGIEFARINGASQEWTKKKWQHYKIIDLLLEELQVPITEDVVRAAARNKDHGLEIIKLLLDRRGDQVPISEGVAMAAVALHNRSPEIIKLLLDRWGDQVPITELVVEAAALFNNQALEIIKLLLDRRGDQVPITEDIVGHAAINKDQGLEIIKLLLDRRGDQVPVTENIIKAAAINKRQGQDIIGLFLSRRRDLDPTIKELLSRIKS